MSSHLFNKETNIDKEVVESEIKNIEIMESDFNKNIS